jgi:hypothetical protein
MTHVFQNKIYFGIVESSITSNMLLKEAVLIDVFLKNM